MLSRIMNIARKDLLSGIVYVASNFTVWEDFKERFDKVNHM